MTRQQREDTKLPPCSAMDTKASWLKQPLEHKQPSMHVQTQLQARLLTIGAAFHHSWNKRVFSIWASFFHLLNLWWTVWAPTTPESPICPHPPCTLSHLPNLHGCSIFISIHRSSLPLLNTRSFKMTSALPQNQHLPLAVPQRPRTSKLLPQNSFPTFTSFSPLFSTSRETFK